MFSVSSSEKLPNVLYRGKTGWCMCKCTFKCFVLVIQAVRATKPQNGSAWRMVCILGIEQQCTGCFWVLLVQLAKSGFIVKERFYRMNSLIDEIYG